MVAFMSWVSQRSSAVARLMKIAFKLILFCYSWKYPAVNFLRLGYYFVISDEINSRLNTLLLDEILALAAPFGTSVGFVDKCRKF